MNTKLISILCIVVAAASVLSSCNLSRNNGGGTVIIDNTPTPTEKVYEHEANAELYQALENGFQDELVLINSYTMPLGYTNAERIILTRSRYVIKLGLIKELFPKGIEEVYKKAEALYPSTTIEHTESIVYPDWQYLAATLPYASNEKCLFYDIMNVKISVNTKVKGVTSITVSAKPLPIEQFAMDKSKEAAEDLRANTYLDIRFTYAYMKAVYDYNGDEISEITNYEFTSDYINTLVFPLDNVPNYRDTWEQGRSGNTRKHMGTDIKNPEGNAIYSCSEGTVIYKGTDKVPGNYLIIMDSFGFEYHYYHLVEVPTEVEAGDKVTKGQLIGHVGNTGNSDASHLHISIIEPNGAFVNPYSLMQLLGERMVKN